MSLPQVTDPAGNASEISPLTQTFEAARFVARASKWDTSSLPMPTRFTEQRIHPNTWLYFLLEIAGSLRECLDAYQNHDISYLTDAFCHYLYFAHSSVGMRGIFERFGLESCFCIFFLSMVFQTILGIKHGFGLIVPRMAGERLTG